MLNRSTNRCLLGAALAVAALLIGLRVIHHLGSTTTHATICNDHNKTDLIRTLEPTTDKNSVPAINEWASPPGVALQEIALTWLASSSPELPSFELALETERVVRVLIGALQTNGQNEGTFSGHIPALPGSTVVVSYVGRAEAGVVHLPSEGIAYDLRLGDDGLRRVRRMDLREAPECAHCLTPSR